MLWITAPTELYVQNNEKTMKKWAKYYFLFLFEPSTPHKDASELHWIQCLTVSIVIEDVWIGTEANY